MFKSQKTFAIVSFALAWNSFGLRQGSSFAFRFNSLRVSTTTSDSLHTLCGSGANSDDERIVTQGFSHHRRNLMLALGLSPPLLLSPDDAQAATSLFSRFRTDKPADLFVVGPGTNASQARQRGPFIPIPYTLSSELCLLRLLPVKNALFRQLESRLEGLSTLQNPTREPGAWGKARNSTLTAISNLDNKRSQLEPVFNPDDSALLQINKGQRSEQLIELLRSRLVEVVDATETRNVTKAFEAQKEALLALAEVGELLVANFPYDVPTEGRYSYLPRLLGRAKVIFTFRRNKEILGNVTIVADGFLAPISAGNFVDLCVRNFYNGLPIKNTKKRLGSGSEFDVANLPIFGSFQEGFYDPLTAKPRRIPLEIVRVDKSTSVPVLSYSQGLANLFGQASLEPTGEKLPLLSFSIPGLVAMSHPEKNANGGSSEFFALQADSVIDDKRSLLDGEYAPFGYITEGMDIFQKIKPGDILDETFVDEWGQLNLVKIRQSSFSEVVQGSE